MKSRNKGQRPWSFRRRVIVTTLLFCASCIAYVMVLGHNSPSVAETIIGSAFTLSGAVIGSYIFGAVWHDKR